VLTVCGERVHRQDVRTAAARKLARWSTMLTEGEEYTDQGQDYYKECYRGRVLKFVATKQSA
jgi:transposase